MPARVGGHLLIYLARSRFGSREAMLRIWGDFQQIDHQNRVELGSSPETWSGARIDDQIREGLHVLVDDGER